MMGGVTGCKTHLVDHGTGQLARRCFCPASLVSWGKIKIRKYC